ncbi:periplasmic sensor signal transduction histidine kinase [Pseudoalteromonas sp. BSi20652]|uniref:sensor histidine kinase n=1 Tax=Pseudoalteromonas sp. BSi20652 TaxID=388384 RepID=UPI0002319BAA|nr:HAMP domain-containing sensor histidine kinase [Pseudoalteromonas sp. BSi20652]GAA59491.1 periplasmic sensor signal transduction histidine kinase [Pseudoalteromonas sp. BSi20652]
MNISKKLMLIVLLTTVEVSITVYSAFEIAKGAKFHHLNFLHLKYVNQLAKSVKNIKNDHPIDINTIKSDIMLVRKQPLDCVNEINFFNHAIMKAINTDHALTICKSDIEIADKALLSLDQYKKSELSREAFLLNLNASLDGFNANSEMFEEPIRKTVSFILMTLIPLVLIISLFNIIFISYLSRTISSSIRNLTRLLLSKPENNINLDDELEKKTTGELKALVIAARQRVKNDILNIENSIELKEIINSQTASLQQANDELAQFAYRASHDLKSPLSGAKSLAHFVIEDIKAGDTEEASQNALVIYQQMEKLESLVVDILLLAKAEIGNEDRDVIDFNQLIIDMKERLSWLMKDNPCMLDTTINLSVPIRSEKARFAQIIENLISNGLKYYDRNKDKSYVRCDIFNEQETFFIIVTDNGMGIPQKHQSEVFDMFKRFHAQISTGSGLGMALVKKHIEYLNGEISLQSSDEGTTFKISIPMDKLT